MPEDVTKVPSQPENGRESKPTLNSQKSKELNMVCEILTTDLLHMP